MGYIHLIRNPGCPLGTAIRNLFDLPIRNPKSAIRNRLTLALAFTALLLAAVAESRAAESRPNILFIMSDDHAYQAVGAYGSGLNRDAEYRSDCGGGRAVRSLLCDEFAVRAEPGLILTGKYSHKNGFYDNSRSVRSTAANDVSEAAAGGRLSDGDRRQMASCRAIRPASTIGRFCRGRASTIGPISSRPKGSAPSRAM